MGPKATPTKQEISLKEMRDFAYDAYDYIWNNHEYVKPDLRKNYLAQLGERLEEERSISKHLTKNVKEGIRSSQILLRNHFAELLKFSHPDINTFKEEAKMLWFHWLVNRSNIFVKLIDTVAIIAEIFLYCDSKKEFTLDLNKAAEWFLEWTEDGFVWEFFRSGGWGQLENICLLWYGDLFCFLNSRMDVVSSFGSAEPKQLEYKCKLIKGLRDSPISFPVPKSALCEKCWQPTDEKTCRNFMYFRVESEFKEAFKVRIPVAPKAGPKSSAKKYLQINIEPKIEDEEDASKSESSGYTSISGCVTECSTCPSTVNSSPAHRVDTEQSADGIRKEIDKRDSVHEPISPESSDYFETPAAIDVTIRFDPTTGKYLSPENDPIANESEEIDRKQTTSTASSGTSVEVETKIETSALNELQDVAEYLESPSDSAIKEPLILSSDLKHELPSLGSSSLEMDLTSQSEEDSSTKFLIGDTTKSAKDVLTPDDARTHQIDTSLVKSEVETSIELKTEVELSTALDQTLSITKYSELPSIVVDEFIEESSELEPDYPTLGSSPKKDESEHSSNYDSSPTIQVLEITASKSEYSMNYPEFIAYTGFLETIQKAIASDKIEAYLLSEKYEYSFKKLLSLSGDEVKSFVIKPFVYESTLDVPSDENISSDPDKTFLLNDVSCCLIGKQSKTKKTAAKIADEKKQSRIKKRKSKSKTSEEVSEPVDSVESEETVQTKL